jgi:hypothetical protein
MRIHAYSDGTMPKTKLKLKRVTPFPIPQSIPVVIIPRVLKIPDAAKYLSATPWFVEQLLRSGEVPSFIQGKDRVVDCRELDKYVERRNAEPASRVIERAANLRAVESKNRRSSVTLSERLVDVAA